MGSVLVRCKHSRISRARPHTIEDRCATGILSALRKAGGESRLAPLYAKIRLTTVRNR